MSVAQSLTRLAAAAAFAALGSACAVSPHHGQHFASRSTPIPFEIYTTSSGATITITCSHHYGNTQTVTTFTGGTSPITYAGDTLYLKKRNVVIPTSCWETFSGEYITYLRVKQGTNNVAVFDKPGLDNCLWPKIFAGESPIASGNACKLSGSDILIYANTP